jgi:hypothetical protein
MKRPTPTHPDSPAQHTYGSVRDKAARNVGEPSVYKSGSLDKALSEMSRTGIKVLGFWRSGGQWVFKIMKPWAVA